MGVPMKSTVFDRGKKNTPRVPANEPGLRGATRRPARDQRHQNASERPPGNLGCGSFRRGCRTTQRLPHLEAGESADDDVLAQLGDLGVE